MAGAYPGYQATEVYPPTGDGDEWVIIVHFDDEAMLQAWLDAPERATWLAKLPHEALGFRQQTMPTGFELVGDPAKHTAEVRFAQAGLALTFTDDPIPPPEEKPAEPAPTAGTPVPKTADALWKALRDGMDGLLREQQGVPARREP